MNTREFDIVVIGGGPAGLAAAKSASNANKKVLLIERENKLGGILKQCIHDGFGLHRYKEKLSGPEYAYREIKALENSNVEVKTLTFVTKIEKINEEFLLHIVNQNGMELIKAKKIILATGCRERTSRQVLINGTNPAGVMTAGQAQYYINILGKIPGKTFVILGSGDIGLIMARRITLEGGKVLGVYEAKPTPSGLARNIAQCLDDFNIPLHLSTTVTKVFGQNHLNELEIAKVDERMNVIKGTEERIKCDVLILSVGLIPENELAESLSIKLSNRTKGPIVDQNLETSVNNVYSCGNAMHVNDLVDYVSESGEIAGRSASIDNKVEKEIIDIELNNNMLYLVPNVINKKDNLKDIIFYFRSNKIFKNISLNVYSNNKIIFTKTYSILKPPEMERVVMSLPDDVNNLCFKLEEKI